MIKRFPPPRDQAGAARGALPNLVVIGAQKCGTSGLHYYLSLHPEISMSKPKELNFFIEERNWPRGVDWYRAYFDAAARRSGASRRPTTPPTRSTRASPSGCTRSIPDAKLIYMVRDPLERIAAHWVHNYAKRREKGDLRATLTHPTPPTWSAASTTCSCSSSSRTTRWSRSLVIEQEELRTAPDGDPAPGVRVRRRRPRLQRTPTFGKQRHQTSRKTRASRLAVRLERLERHARGAASCRRTSGWRSTRGCARRRPIERPDVRARPRARGAAGPARGRRAAARADRARLRVLVDLGRMTPPKRQAAQGQQPKPDKREARQAEARAQPPGRRRPRCSGAQLARFSSMQGLSLLITNILHYTSIVVVAWMLGPGKLGAYALLFFLTGLVTQVIHMLSKPGTMMRTFGVSDDDDDDVEGDDDDGGAGGGVSAHLHARRRRRSGRRSSR